MEHQYLHHDIPPAGMGGTYQDWLRYQEKEERRRHREEQREQAVRTAQYRARAAKAARSRRKRRQAQQRYSALRGVIVAGVAVVLLLARNAITQSPRTER